MTKAALQKAGAAALLVLRVLADTLISARLQTDAR